MVVFALLLLGIGLVDYIFYRAQTNAIKEQAQQQLSAIADLKVQQITNWRKERLGDAEVLRENIFVRVAVADWLRLGLDPEQREQINAWLQSYVTRFDYREALLLDPQGRCWLPHRTTCRFLRIRCNCCARLRTAGSLNSAT